MELIRGRINSLNKHRLTIENAVLHDSLLHRHRAPGMIDLSHIQHTCTGKRKHIRIPYTPNTNNTITIFSIKSFWCLQQNTCAQHQRILNRWKLFEKWLFIKSCSVCVCVCLVSSLRLCIFHMFCWIIVWKMPKIRCTVRVVDTILQRYIGKCPIRGTETSSWICTMCVVWIYSSTVVSKKKILHWIANNEATYI